MVTGVAVAKEQFWVFEPGGRKLQSGCVCVFGVLWVLLVCNGVLSRETSIINYHHQSPSGIYRNLVGFIGSYCAVHTTARESSTIPFC